MSRHSSTIHVILLFTSGIAAAQTATLPLSSPESAVHPLHKTARTGASSGAASDDDTNCRGDVPQSDLVQCMSAESSALEAQIDRYVRSGLDAIDRNDEVTKKERANERREFIAAQKSWVAFRDHLCNAWYWNTDGTGAKLDAVACREKTDRRRVRELLEFPGVT